MLIVLIQFFRNFFVIIISIIYLVLITAQVFSRMNRAEKRFCERKALSLLRRPVLFFFCNSKFFDASPYIYFCFFSHFFTATCQGGNQFAVASNDTDFDQTTAIMICNQHNAKLPRPNTGSDVPLCIRNSLGKLVKASNQHLHFWLSTTTTIGLVWALDFTNLTKSHKKSYTETVKFVVCEIGKLSTDILQKK